MASVSTTLPLALGCPRPAPGIDVWGLRIVPVSWVLSPHSAILASKVFKEASWGAVGVVMVGKQAAGPPTLSTAPA